MWAIWVGFSLDQNTFLGDYVNIAAGGGYGEPEARNPQSVAEDVNRKWLSEERAKSVYKVALLKAANGIDFTVDERDFIVRNVLIGLLPRYRRRTSTLSNIERRATFILLIVQARNNHSF